MLLNRIFEFYIHIQDADIVMSNLDSILFPGISSSIEVHSGFKAAQAKSVNSSPTMQHEY
jgi:hypothetical protein